MWRHVASNALSLLIVGLALVAGLVAWGRAQYQAPGPLTEAVCLEVERGSSFRDVSQSLAAQGAINHPQVFRIGADYEGVTAALKAGSFIIGPGATMEEIVETVTSSGQSTCGTEIVYRIGVTSAAVQLREIDPETGDFGVTAEFEPAAGEVPAAYTEARADGDTRYRVALAEGATSWQVVDALTAADFLEGAVAELPPEGSLAPESYEVELGSARADLLTRMTELQSARLAAAWASRAADVPVATPEEALILASIIEKETGVAAEREQVASVFANRLRGGMRLQTDPTVIYGITSGEGVLGRGLRQSELERVTPYNTYQVDGLPPTPIANPGLASIEAALNPAETDFVFFVADGSGGHAFARTLDEHNENVRRWREIEAEQPNQ